jgi:hypothetical protein
MMQLLAARLDRQQRILVNARLDQYPAYFYVMPQAVNTCLGQAGASAQNGLELLQECWPQLAGRLEQLVRKHGNDFVISEAMLELKNTA